MTALEGSTTLPVVGTTKKSYVAVGAALVAGIAGWAWWKRKQGAPSADATNGGLYADTRTGSELPTSAYTNPAPNADGQSGTGIGGDSSWRAPATDPEWAQQAVDRLSWREQSFVAATAGKYLARQPLTPDEQTLIREAWGLLGHPPGNQPIITAATGTGTTPGPSTSPAAKTAIVGAHITSVSQTMVTLDWSATGRPDSYRVYVNGALRVTTAGTGARIGGLKRATTYQFGIVPVKASVAGPMTQLRTTTKK